MSDILENKLQQLRPIAAKKELRRRCLQAALSQTQDEFWDIGMKWLLAASILLLFSLWIERENQKAFSSKVPAKTIENHIMESELAQIAYSSKIFLSSMQSEPCTRLSLLDATEVPGRWKR